jgi:hypothetical protein
MAEDIEGDEGGRGREVEARDKHHGRKKTSRKKRGRKMKARK